MICPDSVWLSQDHYTIPPPLLDILSALYASRYYFIDLQHLVKRFYSFSPLIQDRLTNIFSKLLFILGFNDTFYIWTINALIFRFLISVHYALILIFDDKSSLLQTVIIWFHHGWSTFWHWNVRLPLTKPSLKNALTSYKKKTHNALLSEFMIWGRSAFSADFDHV